jgi:hypothetical protein
VTDDDRDNLIGFMCTCWPSKFTDSELRDFVTRFEDFRYEDVHGALDAHKNGCKFKPSVAEIRERLKGKRIQAEPEVKWPSLADVIRATMPGLERVSDEEAYIRFYRAQWWRYREDAARRESQMPDIPMFAASRAWHEQQRSGALKRAKALCTHALANLEHVGSERAEIMAEWLDADPQAFRGFLFELRSGHTLAEAFS